MKQQQHLLSDMHQNYVKALINTKVHEILYFSFCSNMAIISITRRQVDIFQKLSSRVQGIPKRVIPSKNQKKIFTISILSSHVYKKVKIRV